MLDYSTLPSVTEDEFTKDPETYFERVHHGEIPLLIINNDGQKYLLFDWEDYWRRFGMLYPDGEKERVEEACRKAALDDSQVQV